MLKHNEQQHLRGPILASGLDQRGRSKTSLPLRDAAERQVFAGALGQKPGHNRGSTNADHNRGSTNVDQRLVSDGWLLEQKAGKCNRQNLQASA